MPKPGYARFKFNSDITYTYTCAICGNKETKNISLVKGREVQQMELPKGWTSATIENDFEHHQINKNLLICNKHNIQLKVDDKEYDLVEKENDSKIISNIDTSKILNNEYRW